MDPERNAATLQRLHDEVMNGHNAEAADELITIDRPDNDPTFPPELTAGRAGFKKLMTMLIGAFPRPAGRRAKPSCLPPPFSQPGPVCGEAGGLDSC
jgi:hypothetical protein